MISWNIMSLDTWYSKLNSQTIISKKREVLIFANMLDKTSAEYIYNISKVGEIINSNKYELNFLFIMFPVCPEEKQNQASIDHLEAMLECHLSWEEYLGEVDFEIERNLDLISVNMLKAINSERNVSEGAIFEILFGTLASTVLESDIQEFPYIMTQKDGFFQKMSMFDFQKEISEYQSQKDLKYEPLSPIVNDWPIKPINENRGEDYEITM